MKLNINSFGTFYTIQNPTNGTSSQVQIIFYETFTEQVGLFDTNHFPHYHEYVNDCNSVLEGTVKTPFHITWYSRRIEQFDLIEAVKEALREGNNKVIVEVIPEPNK